MTSTYSYTYFFISLFIYSFPTYILHFLYPSPGRLGSHTEVLKMSFSFFNGGRDQKKNKRNKRKKEKKEKRNRKEIEKEKEKREK